MSDGLVRLLWMRRILRVEERNLAIRNHSAQDALLQVDRGTIEDLAELTGGQGALSADGPYDFSQVIGAQPLAHPQRKG